jgi:signal transduction histidine kinase/GAF domain-containing protein
VIDLFHYRQIGEALFEELRGRLDAGDSLAVIAPRYGGGRYAMYRLNHHLRETGLASVLFLKLSYREPVSGEAELRGRIRGTVLRESGDVDPGKAGEPLLAGVDRLQATLQKPVILLVRNIDSLPYGLTRRLLEEIRTRIQNEKTLLAVLSGEADFSDLVHGPNSELNCVERYFLQGMDKTELDRFLAPYCQLLRLTFADREAAYGTLWEQTSGNRHLLRMILWEIVEQRARRAPEETKPLETGVLREFLDSIRLPGLYGREMFEHAIRLIDNEPQCWLDLQALCAGETIVFSGAHSPPGPLELAGAAVRRTEELAEESSWVLRFASPLVAQFLCRQYQGFRWGDLYTRAGQLEHGFELYQKVPWEGGARPTTADDRIDTELTVRSLGGPLHAAVAQGSKEVGRLFARCCHYVLGYRDVAFWLFQGGEWRLDEEESFLSLDAEAVRGAAELLPAGSRTGSGTLPVPPPWKKFVIAAVFPALRRDQQCALLLGDFTSRAFISRQREQLTRDFFASFLTAYTQAIAMERSSERLSVRGRHIELINSIFDSLGSHIRDVGHALAVAASGLRRLGYSRVLFCLVNPEGDRIQGEIDDSDDLRVDVARMTDWPLDRPMDDLQPYVISTCRPKLVEDPSREPLANPKVLRRTRMKPFVIVPVLSRSGKAIGTIHVERSDGAVPSESEVADLLLFGRQLAIAIEQSERVNLLQSALDQMPEPVLITDPNLRLRYVNKPAAELLGPADGWRSRSQAEELSAESLQGPLRELLDRSLQSGIRQVRHVHQIRRRDYHGAALLDAIRDWHGRTAGALLHIEDLNYLYRVLAAVEIIAGANDTDSAMHSMLQAASVLGHELGRLFLVEKDDPDLLVGRLSLEPGGEILGGAEVRSVLPRRGTPGVGTWKCIDKKEPIVVCWQENRPADETIVTRRGLVVTNVNPPICPSELEKKPGDFWVDFPLITNRGEVLGKLSLSCDEDLRPEQFELEKVLSAIVSGLLDAFLRRDQYHDQMLAERENRVLWQAAEETLALASHNIATRLASLPVLLARYRRQEHSSAVLRELNSEFSDIYAEIIQSIERIQERLSFVKPNCRHIDLPATVRKVLASALPPKSWNLKGAQEDLEIDGDSHLLGNAILEMIQNSRELMPPRKKLRVKVALERLPRPAGEWVQIIYQDNGPGVPGELKKKIFTPFFTRRPGRKTSTGLGLTFVRHVVEAHGGVISEDGLPEQGARFVIEFPRFQETRVQED